MRIEFSISAEIRKRNGAERGIRTPEAECHRFSRPAPWSGLSYLRFDE